MLKTRLQRQACRTLILGALLVGALVPTGQVLAAPIELPVGVSFIDWIVDWWSGHSAAEAVTEASESVADDDVSGDLLAPGIDSGETSNTTTSTTGTGGDGLPDWDPDG